MMSERLEYHRILTNGNSWRDIRNHGKSVLRWRTRLRLRSKLFPSNSRALNKINFNERIQYSRKPTTIMGRALDRPLLTMYIALGSGNSLIIRTEIHTYPYSIGIQTIGREIIRWLVRMALIISNLHMYPIDDGKLWVGIVHLRWIAELRK
jgi:hypothetical protein